MNELIQARGPPLEIRNKKPASLGKAKRVFKLRPTETQEIGRYR